ncbi:MAG: ABC transporter ATP-binding protein [Acidobacteriota bacterium]
MPSLLLEKLAFDHGDTFKLNGVDLSIPEGSFLALIGPNGSGKTTLLQLMSGLLTPRAGRILLDGQPLNQFNRRHLARQMAVISSEQHFEFPFPVAEVVTMGRFPYLDRFGKLSRRDREIIDDAMEWTQTSHLRDRPISQLSSGERQRVLIARAVAQQPAILMLDEPNVHLDLNHQISIFRLLRRLNQDSSVTIVIVLHDLTAAAVFCQQVALMSQGSLVKTGSPHEVITTETLREVYQADIEVHPSPLDGLPQVAYRAETVKP